MFAKWYLQNLCLLMAHRRKDELVWEVRVLIRTFRFRKFDVDYAQAGSGMLGGLEMMHGHGGHGGHGISSMGGHGGLGTSSSSQSVMSAGSHASPSSGA